MYWGGGAPCAAEPPSGGRLLLLCCFVLFGGIHFMFGTVSFVNFLFGQKQEPSTHEGPLGNIYGRTGVWLVVVLYKMFLYIRSRKCRESRTSGESRDSKRNPQRKTLQIPEIPEFCAGSAGPALGPREHLLTSRAKLWNLWKLWNSQAFQLPVLLRTCVISNPLRLQSTPLQNLFNFSDRAQREYWFVLSL